MSDAVRTWLADEVRRYSRLPPPRVDDAARLPALGIDAVGEVALVVAAEDRFGVEIDDPDLTGVTTFGDMVALIDRKRAGAAA